MTNTRPNPHYLPKTHPVRVLLEGASLGLVASRAQLDVALDRPDQPDEVNLRRFRVQLGQDVARVAKVYAPTPNSAAFADARRLADELSAKYAAEMNDTEAAIEGPDPATVESLDSIQERMFKR